MAFSDVQKAVYAVFPVADVQTTAGIMSLQSVMIAIAGAESRYNGLARGDKIGTMYALPGGGMGTIMASQWNCQGYTSFGAWQVNLPANHMSIQGAVGTTIPCDLASWLANYTNCAQAARSIYNSQGLGAWTTYRNGAWAKELGLVLATPATTNSGQSNVNVQLSAQAQSTPSATATATAVPAGGLFGSGIPVVPVVVGGIALMLLLSGVENL